MPRQQLEPPHSSESCVGIPPSTLNFPAHPGGRASQLPLVLEEAADLGGEKPPGPFSTGLDDKLWEAVTHFLREMATNAQAEITTNNILTNCLQVGAQVPMDGLTRLASSFATFSGILSGFLFAALSFAAIELPDRRSVAQGRPARLQFQAPVMILTSAFLGMLTCSLLFHLAQSPLYPLHLATFIQIGLPIFQYSLVYLFLALVWSIEEYRRTRIVHAWVAAGAGYRMEGKVNVSLVRLLLFYTLLVFAAMMMSFSLSRFSDIELERESLKTARDCVKATTALLSHDARVQLRQSCMKSDGVPNSGNCQEANLEASQPSNYMDKSSICAYATRKMFEETIVESGGVVDGEAELPIQKPKATTKRSAFAVLFGREDSSFTWIGLVPTVSGVLIGMALSFFADRVYRHVSRATLAFRTALFAYIAILLFAFDFMLLYFADKDVVGAILSGWGWSEVLRAAEVRTALQGLFAGATLAIAALLINSRSLHRTFRAQGPSAAVRRRL